ncbi:MAG: nuclear transport factor 2 family protein [Hyphomonadaceae bacterium]|nr:MAG: hypothetical protein FD160_431 [Caulobacteraceae bacterium]MBT9447180.1 nuclear transport factor 2 family protein [Hyphomonadaceae bacterium]TPW08202.1 MAG: hypothetical protein FD124_563 [Alphaproteobacteria bacterium]
MDRAAYEHYVHCFNARDYDAIFDFYADNPDISFFGVTIRSREALKSFYGFLHRYVRETVRIERFASSDELVAVEGVVRVEGIRDLDQKTLDENKMGGLFPISAGQVQEMRQYIHYHLKDGKFASVGCAVVG